MIKTSQRFATDEIKITASTWSPPIWMKTNEAITGFGQLRPEYYQSYADYHLKLVNIVYSDKEEEGGERGEGGCYKFCLFFSASYHNVITVVVFV